MVSFADCYKVARRTDSYILRVGVVKQFLYVHIMLGSQAHAEQDFAYISADVEVVFKVRPYVRNSPARMLTQSPSIWIESKQMKAGCRVGSLVLVAQEMKGPRCICQWTRRVQVQGKRRRLTTHRYQRPAYRLDFVVLNLMPTTELCGYINVLDPAVTNVYYRSHHCSKGAKIPPQKKSTFSEILYFSSTWGWGPFAS